MLIATDEELCAFNDVDPLAYWNRILRSEGLGTIGGFLFRCRRLPPWTPKPPERPSRAMSPQAEEALRRERLGESIGLVIGDKRPFGARRVKLHSHGFTLSQKRWLLENGYDRRIIIPGEQPLTIEGPNGAYAISLDRGKRPVGSSDDQSEHDSPPQRSALAGQPVQCSQYRATGQVAFERRLTQDEAQRTINRVRDTSLHKALYEVCHKGRLPGDVAAECGVDVNRLYLYAKRTRLKVRGEAAPKPEVPRIPIAFKTILVDGKEHVVSVYPPAHRHTRFARRSR